MMMRPVAVGVGLTALLMMSGLLTARGQQAAPLTAFATNTPLPGLEPAAVSTPTPAVPAPVQPVQVFEPPECRYVPGQPASEACLAIIANTPRPDFQRVPHDHFTLENYSFWRVGPEPVTTFDAPGGNPIGQIGQGFNFVRAVNEVDGWIQAENGGWISKQNASLRRPSYFRGVLLPEGWNQPFAWVLDTTGIWASTRPGGPPDSSSGLVPLHYQMFNIFAEEMGEDGWLYYKLGPNQWVKQIYLSVIKPVARPEGVSGRWVAIDLFEQSLVAYEDDRPVFATLISTGLPGTETREGLFRVWARLARDTMSGFAGAPNAYALQSVPWVQYFDGDISLHGTYWHDFFGYRRSRGCVNLTISDARWLYHFLEGDGEKNENGVVANWIYVYSTGVYRRG
jgi:hypothetical protein